MNYLILNISLIVLGGLFLMFWPRSKRKTYDYDKAIVKQINKSKAPLWIKNFYLGLNQAIVQRRNFLCDVKGHDIKALYQGLRFYHNLDIGDIDILSSDPEQEIMVVKTKNLRRPLELRLGDPKVLDKEQAEIFRKYGIEISDNVLDLGLSKSSPNDFRGIPSYKPFDGRLSSAKDYENVIQVDFSKKRKVS